jgi:hypothetical protein
LWAHVALWLQSVSFHSVHFSFGSYFTALSPPTVSLLWCSGGACVVKWS